MGEIKTINQILTVLEDVSQRHYQINSYGVGASFEIAASTEVIYPLLWVNPISATMQRGNNNNYAAFEATVNLKMLDLVNKDETNENDVSSDTVQMLQDIITEFCSHPYYRESNFQIVGDVNFTPLDEVSDDETNGWECELLFRTPYVASYCTIPVSEISGFSFPSPSCTGLTVSNVTYVSNIINSDGNLDITHTGSTYEINSTVITNNTADILANATGITANADSIAINVTGITSHTSSITANTASIVSLDSNKYDKSGGTISGTVHLQENIYFDDQGSVITATGTTMDLSSGNIFLYQLSGSTELDYSNPEIGSYIVEINGQTTSSVLTFAATKFKSPLGTIPELTATASAIDSFSMYYNGDKMVVFTANNIIDLI